jgi:hypothetical protein
VAIASGGNPDCDTLPSTGAGPLAIADCGASPKTPTVAATPTASPNLRS